MTQHPDTKLWAWRGGWWSVWDFRAYTIRAALFCCSVAFILLKWTLLWFLTYCHRRPFWTVKNLRCIVSCGRPPRTLCCLGNNRGAPLACRAICSREPSLWHPHYNLLTMKQKPRRLRFMLCYLLISNEKLYTSYASCPQALSNHADLRGLKNISRFQEIIL